MALLIVIEDLAAPATIGRGGQTMHLLQWLHGLRNQGHQVLFLEFLQKDPGKKRERAVQYFRDTITEWWDPDWAALFVEPTLESLYGMDAQELRRMAGKAAALITLAAHYRAEPFPFVDKIRPRILIEQDPGYTHLWARDDDPVNIYGEHDIYFTVGMNIGTRRCQLPTLGIDWRPIGYPIVLSWWPTDRPLARDRFTTIADWRGYGYLEFEGQTLGPKAEEFRKFIKLPRLIKEPVEIAILIDEEDPDVAYLQKHGWKLESTEVVASPALFRDYIAGSLGEFSCTKGGYVGTRSGWFSDRSAGYLASGRPVVLQATGFEDTLPTGKGLFAAADVEEAAEAIRAIRKDYQAHRAAARDLAGEYFDANKVARYVLKEAGISGGVRGPAPSAKAGLKSEKAFSRRNRR
jgi:hypothetical protein